MDQRPLISKQEEKKEQPPSSRQIGLPTNGQLRLYNQFPRCYQNIDQMTLQLPQIALMGFNAVWINPIQLLGVVEIEKTIEKEDKIVKKSLYAMSRTDMIDDAFSVTKNNSPFNPENILAIQRYTKTARQWGLTPLFDLVLNHMAADSPLITHPETKSWFKSHTAFDEDVIDFDYQNHGKEIVQFWKGYIDFYIIHLGFVGVRIDAIKHLPREYLKEIIEYIVQTCKEVHKVSPIILAEVFLGPRDNLADISVKYQNLGITHVTNNLHWQRFTVDCRGWEQWGRNFWGNGWERPWDTPSIPSQTGLFRQIVHGKNDRAQGGTIGFSGCHDSYSLHDLAIWDKARSIVEDREGYKYPIDDYKTKVNTEIEKLKSVDPHIILFHLKEHIAAMAFTSDAGWYLLSGDEFGHPGKKWVFDFYKPWVEHGSFDKHWGGKFDLREFVTNVNAVLAQLPLTPHREFWVQHVVLKSHPEFMIVIRHNCRGYDTTPEIVITNLSTKSISLSFDDIKEIAQIASLREREHRWQEAATQCVLNSISEGKIFCVGQIKLANLIADKNVKLFNTARADPVLIAQIGSQNFHFMEEWVKPDGNCGFTTLGTDRQTLVDTLLPLLDKPDRAGFICQFLADEIKNAFLSNELSPKLQEDPEWKGLLQKFILTHHQIDAEIRAIKEKVPIPKDISALPPVQLLQWLKHNHPQVNVRNLEDQLTLLANIDKSMTEYCQRPDIVKKYLQEYNTTNLWLGIKTMYLYAQEKNINLYIFHKDEQTGQLKYQADISRNVSNPTTSIYLVHTAGFTHFNLLRYATQEEITNYQQLISQRSPSLSVSSAPTLLPSTGSTEERSHLSAKK